MKRVLFYAIYLLLISTAFVKAADENIEIKSKYGPEFTFTNTEILNASKSETDANNPTNQKLLKEWVEDIKELCKIDNCNILETTDKHGKAYKVTFPDGKWIQYAVDTMVLEVQTNPRTVDEFKADRDLLDKYIFKSAEKRGMKPHQRIGGGHVNVDLETGFKENSELFRNFLVDQANHPERVFGILGNHLGNSPPISALEEKSHTAFQEMIDAFDENPKGGIEGIRELSKKMNSDVYTNNPFGWDRDYYQHLSLRSVSSYTPKDQQRVEMRGHHPQQSIDEFIAQIDFNDKRLTYLANLDEPLEVDIPSKNAFEKMSDRNKVEKFFRTLGETGIGPDELDRRLIPYWLNIKLDPFMEELKITSDFAKEKMKAAIETRKIKKQFPKTIRKLLDWEFNANSANDKLKRGPQYFKVQHYEVPTSLIDMKMLDTLDPKIKRLLIFKKNGKEYFKWIINPEDTKFHKEIKKLLDKKGYPSKLRSEFAGGLTSSRSMFIRDLKSQTTFSIKVGTNKTGGNWQDKGVNENQVTKALLANEVQTDATKANKLQALKVQPETMGGVIKELNQGFIIREFEEDVLRGKKIYLPGFSALDDKTGVKIAKMNGYEDPIEFWKEAYYKPLGRASAEMQATMGLAFTSAHSQQYLIEFDEDMKPTGKIIFRDIADSDAWKTFYDGDEDFSKKWLDNYLNKNVYVRSGTLHGMAPPSWMDPDKYRKLNEAFYEEYTERFSKMTGIPKDEITKSKFDGYYKSYYVTDIGNGESKLSKINQWDLYKEMIPCYKGSTLTKTGRKCTAALRLLRIKNRRNGCLRRAFNSLIRQPSGI